MRSIKKRKISYYRRQKRKIKLFRKRRTRTRQW